MQVKDAIVSALESVANEGYAEKERKRNKRTPAASAGSTGKDYTARWSDIDKFPGVPQKVGGHTVRRDDVDPGLYYVDGMAMSREEATDVTTN